MVPGSLLTNQFNGIPRQFWTLHFCCIWRVHCTFAIRLTVSRRASRGSRASWASRAALGALGFGYSFKVILPKVISFQDGPRCFFDLLCLKSQMIAVFQKRSAKIACAKRTTTKNGPEQHLQNFLELHMLWWSICRKSEWKKGTTKTPPM